MYQNTYYIQKSHQKTDQILENLHKYKTYYTKMLLQKNYQPEQKQHMIRIMQSTFEKVQLDMLTIYDYLEEKQQQNISSIIEILVDIVKLNRFYEDQSDKNIINNRANINQLFCYNCKIAIQKSRIKKMKNKIGLTQVLNFQQTEQLYKNIHKLCDDDGFIQKQNLFLSSLQFHKSQLMCVIEKKIFGKTAHFLGSDTSSFITKDRQMMEQQTNFAIAAKQYAQIQKYRTVLTQKFIQQLKVPIQKTVLRILRNIEKKNKRQYKDLLLQKQVQTVFKTQNQVNAHLEQKITHLQSQISRLRSAKVQSEKNVYKFLERQAELKKQLSNISQQKIILQEKYKKYLETANQVQSKLKYEIQYKTSKIQKLQKSLYDLRQKKPDNQISKISTKSIQSKKALSKTQIIEIITQKQSNLINQRPSLDSKVLEEQSQNTNLSRFNKNNHKYSQVKRNKRVLDSSVNRQVKILDKHQQISDKSDKSDKSNKSDNSSQKARTNISSNKKDEVKKKFNIFQQINLKIENQKLKEKNEQIVPALENESNRNAKSFGKKVKTIRFLKPHRKQPKQQRQYSIQKIQNLSFNNTFRNESNNEDNDRHKIFGKKLYQILRLRTDPHEGKQNKSKDRNKSMQKINPSTVLVRQIKQKQQKTSKQVSELIQIKAQNIILFGNDKGALQYQKNGGLWAHLITADKLSVDVENTNQCIQIQKYFKYLQENREDKYNQYIKFLLNPFTFLQNKKRNYNHQIPMIATHTIKQIFTKIIRYHKIVHKNCCHVMQFLQMIGFYQFCQF